MTFLAPDIGPSLGFATLVEGPDLFFCSSRYGSDPADPRVLPPTLGPGVFANTLATFELFGAKLFAPTTLMFPSTYFCKLFTISVLTFATLR